MRSLLAAEANEPLGWWYLSFVGEHAFLGACIVQARGMTSAIQVAHALGINPGGEVGAMHVPDPGPFPTNQLLSRAELEAIENAARSAAS